MKQAVFGVFAHPDDEGFGPSGTLYKAAQAGSDVHLTLLTGGDAGRNPDGHTDLAAARLEEWRKSGSLIGAASMKSFGYKDGTLCNNVYLEIAGKLLDHMRDILSSYRGPVEFSVITTDPNGITGHLDHIAASLVATYAYIKLRDNPIQDVTAGTLKYACINRMFVPRADVSWIYMPAGRTDEFIDETVDISDAWDKKLEIMRAHASQREDMEWILSRGKEALAREYFWYFKD